MSAEEFVNALTNKDNLGAEDAFKTAMSHRIGDALETKRKEVANTFVQSTKVVDDGDKV